MRIAPGARVAVTGLSGLIGQALEGELTTRGYRIRALGRGREQSSVAENFSLDLSETGEIPARALEGCDALIHLAAHIPRDQNEPAEAETCFRVNAVGTLRLLQAAGPAGVKAVIHAGAGNAYAPSPAPRRESDPLFPSGRAAFYLTSKVAAEIFAEHWSRGQETRICCLRLGSVYGAARAGLLTRWADAALQGEPLRLANGGAYGADFVSSRDAARALSDALASDVAGPVNIGTGVRTSLLELAGLFLEEANAPRDRLVMEPEMADGDRGFCALDIDRARRVLGFEPTLIAEGVRALVAERRRGISSPESRETPASAPGPAG